MSANLSTFAEVAEQLTRIAGIVALAYIIVMGLIHRAGVRQGTRTAQHRRKLEGKPIVSPLLPTENPSAFWKDEKLIQGGLRGAANILMLCGYVVILLLVYRPSANELPARVSILLAYPKIMAALCVLPMTAFLGRNSKPGLWLFAALSVIAAVASWSIAKQPGVTGLGLQASIFIFQSVFICYVVGVHDGVRAADFERRLPIVEVLTVGGEVIEGLRIRSMSQTE